MRIHLWAWFCSIPLLLLMPCLSVIGFQGSEAVFRNRSCGVEDFLSAVLEKQISGNMEAETLKCQAVAARSNLYRHLEQGEDFVSEINWALGMQGMTYGRIEGSVWFKNLCEDSLKVFHDASAETRGMVLREQGKWRLIPYHEISNGKTRNGEEVFHDEAYAYLKSVDSDMDQEAKEYLSSKYLSKEQMPEELKILSRDSAGYVLSLSANGKPVEGEAFRNGMQLLSSDFTVQKIGENYRFLCKGKGHGLGLSQNGANVLAGKGKSYKEILEWYFPALELTEFQKDEIEIIAE